MIPSLAERLKTETRTLHTAAERSTLMRALLRGRLQQTVYCALLRNLHAIYAALEPALARHQTHPLIAPVFLAALWRTRALERDLVALDGPHWPDVHERQPAATAYVARLAALESSQPGLLLAHAYVRYLGDLSGGQILSGIVAKTLSPEHAGAVAFYDFGDAAETQALVQAFRVGLRSVVIDVEQTDRLVAEARLSFALHQRLFDELASASGLQS